jgi:hypothetical protein
MKKLVDNNSNLLDIVKKTQTFLMDKIDLKNDLYLEPLNFDFDTASVVSDLYMFQQSINNIIKVLNKITKTL